MRLNITIQNYDKPLLFSILFLCAFGTIMLYSASWNESYIRSGGLTESLFLEGHLKRIILGFFCLFLFFLIDYKNLKPIAPYFLTISIALLIMTKGYYLIRGINSPARWLYLSGLSIQTSDVARLSLIIFLAYYLDEIKMRIKNLYKGFLPCIIAVGTIMAFIVIQPDFSTALMVGTIGLVIIFVAGAKMLHIFISILTGILICIPIIYLKPYRWARIVSFFDKSDIQTNGYQAHQAFTLWHKVMPKIESPPSYTSYRLYFFNYWRRTWTFKRNLTSINNIFFDFLSRIKNFTKMYRPIWHLSSYRYIYQHSSICLCKCCSCYWDVSCYWFTNAND